MGDGLFAFGADFVTRLALSRGVILRRSLGGEDYSLSAACGWDVLWGRSFDAQAEEHFAAAEVGLGGVVECVLFLDAGLGGGAEGFDFALDRGDVLDAEFDFDLGAGLFQLEHGDSIGRLLPKMLECQHNLFVARASG